METGASLEDEPSSPILIRELELGRPKVVAGPCSDLAVNDSELSYVAENGFGQTQEFGNISI